ncbi:MAG: glycerol-3-phosphate 1-O-acyltransferase PlsY [Planctomycetaceae bacterium]|nr:glycerol-3-phosphate 1-O-acyltransferase PlsY [Planctomycetaceae bacterium]
MAVAVFLLSYLLGSIPFGLILGKTAGKDIRLEGSRNIGATNLWRVCGWKYGLAGFVLDFLKGLLAVLLVAGLVPSGLPAPYPGIIAAVGAVMGHNYPVWLRFKGGKGVATSAGAVAGLMWLPFVCALAVFVIAVAVWHYISLGSMLASVALVAATGLLLPDPFGVNLPLFVLAALLSAMLLIRHRGNVARIMAGTENRFPPPKKAGT